MTSNTTSTTPQRELSYSEAWKARYELDPYKLPADTNDDFDIQNKQSEIEKRTTEVFYERLSWFFNEKDTRLKIGYGLLGTVCVLSVIGIPIGLFAFNMLCKKIAKNEVKNAIAAKRIDIISDMLNSKEDSNKEGNSVNASFLDSKVTQIQEIAKKKIFGRKFKVLAARANLVKEAPEEHRTYAMNDLKIDIICMLKEIRDDKQFSDFKNNIEMKKKRITRNIEDIDEKLADFRSFKYVDGESEEDLNTKKQNLQARIDDLDAFLAKEEIKFKAGKWQAISSGQMYDVLVPQEKRLENVKINLKNELTKAVTQLETAQKNYDQAQKELDEAQKTNDDVLVKNKLTALANAQVELERASNLEKEQKILNFCTDTLDRGHENVTIGKTKIEAGLNGKQVFGELKNLIDRIEEKYKLSNDQRKELFFLLQISTTQLLKNPLSEIPLVHEYDKFASNNENIAFDCNFQFDEANNNLSITFDVKANFQSSEMNDLKFVNGKHVTSPLYSVKYKLQLSIDLKKLQQNKDLLEDCLSIQRSNFKFSDPIDVSTNKKNDNNIDGSQPPKSTGGSSNSDTKSTDSNSSSNNQTLHTPNIPYPHISQLFFYRNINTIEDEGIDFDDENYVKYLENRTKYSTIDECVKRTLAQVKRFDKKLINNISSTLMRPPNQSHDIPHQNLNDINQELIARNTTSRNIISNLAKMSNEGKYSYASDLLSILLQPYFHFGITIIKLKQYLDVIKESDKSREGKDKAITPSSLPEPQQTLIEILTKDPEIGTEEDAILQANLPENQSSSPSKLKGPVYGTWKKIQY